MRVARVARVCMVCHVRYESALARLLWASSGITFHYPIVCVGTVMNRGILASMKRMPLQGGGETPHPHARARVKHTVIQNCRFGGFAHVRACVEYKQCRYNPHCFNRLRYACA